MKHFSDDIDYLMAVVLDGEATKEEIETFECYIENNAQLKRNLERLVNVREKMKRNIPSFNVNTEKAWHQVSNQSKGIERRKWLYAAACAIVLLCVGTLTYYDLNSTDCFSNQYRGNNMVVLEIAGLGEMELDKTENKVLKRKDEVLFYAENGKLITPSQFDNKNKAENTLNNLRVPRGGEYQIQLSDGTQVWINAASELSFPSSFTTTERRVYLKGEAYFDVKSDSLRPFVVITSSMEIEVLGTSFNVSSYENEDLAHTTLVKGCVQVGMPGRLKVQLNPGEQACVVNNELTIGKVEVDYFTSWLHGNFMFKDRPLSEICNKLGRWYDVDFECTDSGFLDERFTGGVYRFDSLGNVLSILESLSELSFTKKESKIIVSKTD